MHPQLSVNCDLNRLQQKINKNSALEKTCFSYHEPPPPAPGCPPLGDRKRRDEPGRIAGNTSLSLRGYHSSGGEAQKGVRASEMISTEQKIQSSTLSPRISFFPEKTSQAILDSPLDAHHSL